MRYQPIVQLGHDGKLCAGVSCCTTSRGGVALLTMDSKVEEGRELPRSRIESTRILELGIRIAQFVEEGMCQRLDRRKTLRWRVFQQPRDELYRLLRSLTEHLESISTGSETSRA